MQKLFDFVHNQIFFTFIDQIFALEFRPKSFHYKYTMPTQQERTEKLPQEP